MVCFFRVVLTVVAIYLCVELAHAIPADAGAKSTTMKPKDVKEIKETATASKDVKDAIKNAKEAKKTKKECVKDCGVAFDPVCAHDPAVANYKPKSFGSQCALDVHNCEMGTSEYCQIWLFSSTLILFNLFRVSSIRIGSQEQR